MKIEQVLSKREVIIRVELNELNLIHSALMVYEPSRHYDGFNITDVITVDRGVKEVMIQMDKHEPSNGHDS